MQWNNRKKNIIYLLAGKAKQFGGGRNNGGSNGRHD